MSETWHSGGDKEAVRGSPCHRPWDIKVRGRRFQGPSRIEGWGISQLVSPALFLCMFEEMLGPLRLSCSPFPPFSRQGTAGQRQGLGSDAGPQTPLQA